MNLSSSATSPTQNEPPNNNPFVGAGASSGANAEEYNFSSNLFSFVNMALINSNDFWLVRLLFIFLGYGSVLVPVYLFVQFVKRRWQGKFSSL
jgi:hypothetical protein